MEEKKLDPFDTCPTCMGIGAIKESDFPVVNLDDLITQIRALRNKPQPPTLGRVEEIIRSHFGYEESY